MSNKIDVIVRSYHTINDDDGRAMNPHEAHTVVNTPLIQSYISDGLLVIAPTNGQQQVAEIEAEDAEVKAETKKPQNTNKSKQETAEIL